MHTKNTEGATPDELSCEDRDEEQGVTVEHDQTAIDTADFHDRLAAMCFAALFDQGVAPICSCCADKRPSDAVLDTVQVGSFVKIPHKTSHGTERLVMCVTHIKRRRYRGILHCNSVFDPALHPGDRLSFSRKDIVDVIGDT